MDKERQGWKGNTQYIIHKTKDISQNIQYLQILEGVVLETFSVHELTSCCSGKSSESVFGLKSNDIMC